MLLNPSCPKCGQRMIGPQYEKLHGKESLKFVCLCGFELKKPTLDSKDGE